MTTTLLFTYHRYQNTKTVVDALMRNTVKPEKLIVFQDGVKDSTNIEGWNKVNQLIHELKFCDTEVIVSKSNKGLAQSIIEGIDYAFQSCDQVIVLEDDCVPAVDFMNYMEQAFEAYRDSKDVWSISGYAWPIEVASNDYDAYFTGRVSSWGWGTWKDRWQYYEQDFSIIDRIKSNQQTAKNLLCWGRDLEQMLMDRKAQRNDSWAVFWALIVIEQMGKCLAPINSLIMNIGMDGTGTNCGVTHTYDVTLYDGISVKYSFTEKTVFEQSIIQQFISLLGSEFSISSGQFEAEHILAYGAGNYIKQNDKFLLEHYFIEAVIDKNQNGYMGGIKIIKPHEISEFPDIDIIIMIYDRQVCEEVKEMLIFKYGIDEKRIKLGSKLIKEISEI